MYILLAEDNREKQRRLGKYIETARPDLSARMRLATCADEVEEALASQEIAGAVFDYASFPNANPTLVDAWIDELVLSGGRAAIWSGAVSASSQFSDVLICGVGVQRVTDEDFDGLLRYLVDGEHALKGQHLVFGRLPVVLGVRGREHALQLLSGLLLFSFSWPLDPPLAMEESKLLDGAVLRGLRGLRTNPEVLPSWGVFQGVVDRISRVLCDRDSVVWPDGKPPVSLDEALQRLACSPQVEELDPGASVRDSFNLRLAALRDQLLGPDR